MHGEICKLHDNRVVLQKQNMRERNTLLANQQLAYEQLAKVQQATIVRETDLARALVGAEDRNEVLKGSIKYMEDRINGLLARYSHPNISPYSTTTQQESTRTTTTDMN